ncbi:hypothetical protein ABH933_001221 [Nocardia sp. GP40]|uniref:hypothetical protein n=1 Tax=Nocardia sp. GP40 TaxID=3156268 RepID=UPI003D2362B2
MIMHNELRRWLDTLPDDSAIIIDGLGRHLLALDRDGILTTARCDLGRYDYDDRYRHLVAIAHRRGPGWTPDPHQARVLAEAWYERDRPALADFADGLPLDQIDTRQLVADVTALADALERNQKIWPYTDDPAPHIAAAHALQRHISQVTVHNDQPTSAGGNDTENFNSPAATEGRGRPSTTAATSSADTGAHSANNRAAARSTSETSSTTTIVHHLTATGEHDRQ